MPNIDGLVWLGYLTHVSEDISAPHTRINLPIALLERCCQAGRFEYDNLGAKKRSPKYRLNIVYSKQSALQHGSNAVISNLIQVRGAEISSDKCQILTVWFG